MFKKILVGTDFSEPSMAARRTAMELTRRLGAELLIVHVEEPLPAYAFSEGGLPDLPRLQEEVRGWAERELDRLGKEARDAGVPVRTAVLIGTPASTIVETVRAEGVDLVVVGTHGRTGLAHVLIGSVAERIVRQAPCPVLSVKSASRAEQEARAKPAA